MPLTGPFPSEMPELFPPHQAMHYPLPQKWADAKPAEDDYPGTGEALRYDTPLAPFPVVAVEIGSQPFNPPDIVIDVPVPAPSFSKPDRKGRSGRVRTRMRKNSAKRQRPGKRKEVKPNVARVGGKWWIAINAATEVQDFLEAANKALPKDCQAKPKGGDYKKRKGKSPAGIGKPRPQDILAALWNCWDEFDADKFVEEYINNQIEDFAFGNIGQFGAKATRGLGITTGLQSAMKKAQPKGEDLGASEDATELPLPTVKFDEESGMWFLSIPGVQQVEVPDPASIASILVA